jgi:hypothetical protein
MSSTGYMVTRGFTSYLPSKPIHSMFSFAASISTTSIFAFSCRGSNWAYCKIVYTWTIFSSACSVFILAAILILSSNDNVFQHCFISFISSCNLSCFPCSSCKLASSSSCAHNEALFSNSFVMHCVAHMMFSIEVVASCLHCEMTSGEMVGTACSSSSFIWSLYCSKVCAIFLIFSWEDVSSDSALAGMLWNIILMNFSISVTFCCATRMSFPSWLISSCNALFSSRIVCKFVASVLPWD